MGVLEDVREQYPSLAFLLNDPEVGPLLREAVDPNKGFSPTTFQAKLYQTKWYTSRSQAAREWEILRHTDPGEAKRRTTEATTTMRGLANQLGINLTPDELKFIVGANIAQGIDLNSPEAMYKLFTWAKAQKGSKFSTTGSIHGQARNIAQTARGQYYIDLSENEKFDWGAKLAMGMADQTTMNAWLQNKAASRYPHLGQALMAGQSMEDIFSGHRQLIAETLEIAPDTIDFRNGQWQKVIGTRDPKTNEMRPMTLYEASTLARQDNRWWSTQNGRQADAGMANFILKTFGARA